MASKASGAEFEQRARLEVVWQDLITPVRAVLGYQEILGEAARKLQLGDIAAYLEKVLVAANSLGALVDSLHDARFEARGEEADGVADMQARLRHDLRNPLNAIIGYSEMAVEDLQDLPAGQALLPDLAKLLAEARHLLGRIDAIIDLSRSGPAESAEDSAAEVVIADLLKTLGPRGDAAKPNETGRILVVDDNESNRDLLCRRLGLEGHTPTSVMSGREALTALETEPFDLILLDLLMPDMNGIEVLERLKADLRWRDTPVIMISGLSETDAVIRCIEAGAEDYLPKPVNPILLRARINASLERKRWRDRERDYLASLQSEKDRSEALLHNILPGPVVLRLNAGERLIADRFDDASILFADIVGFTPAAAIMQPSALVDRLNRIFSQFDALATALGVEKIKTIGDAYMAAAGLPQPRPDHVQAMAEFGLAMLAAVDRINEEDEVASLQIRVGIHAGTVVAGVIGRHKFIYDVWGDTVNIASRLESQGVPGRIQVSEPVRSALRDRYCFEPLGSIPLKGRGEMPAYLLIAPNQTSAMSVAS